MFEDVGRFGSCVQQEIILHVQTATGIDHDLAKRFYWAVRMFMTHNESRLLNHSDFADERVWRPAYIIVVVRLCYRCYHLQKAVARRLLAHRLSCCALGRALCYDRLLSFDAVELLYRHGHHRGNSTTVWGPREHTHALTAFDEVKSVVLRRLTDAGASPLVANLVAEQLAP